MIAHNTPTSKAWLKTSSKILRTDLDSPRLIAVGRPSAILPQYRGMVSQIVTPPGILNTYPS